VSKDMSYEVIASFDAFRFRFSELHSDLVGMRLKRAVEKLDQIEMAFSDLRRVIREAAAEEELTK
jgi:hypothetical protein